MQRRTVLPDYLCATCTCRSRPKTTYGSPLPLRSSNNVETPSPSTVANRRLAAAIQKSMSGRELMSFPWKNAALHDIIGVTADPLCLNGRAPRSYLISAINKHYVATLFAGKRGTGRGTAIYRRPSSALRSVPCEHGRSSLSTAIRPSPVLLFSPVHRPDGTSAKR